MLSMANENRDPTHVARVSKKMFLSSWTTQRISRSRQGALLHNTGRSLAGKPG